MTHISRPIQIALAAVVLFIAVWFVALAATRASHQLRAPRPRPPPPPRARLARPLSANAPGGGTPAVQGPRLPRLRPRRRRALASDPARPGRGRAVPAERAAGRAEVSGSGAQGPRTRRVRHRTARPRAAADAANPAAAEPAATADPAAVAEQVLEHAGHPREGRARDAGRRRRRARARQDRRGAHLEPQRRGRRDRAPRTARRGPRCRTASSSCTSRARAQVGSFGSFARAVQVYSTPTILLIDSKGRTSSITGLTDVFAIEQSLHELHKAK